MNSIENCYWKLCVGRLTLMLVSIWGSQNDPHVVFHQCYTMGQCSRKLCTTVSFQLSCISVICVVFDLFMNLQPVLRTIKHIKGVSCYTVNDGRTDGWNLFAGSRLLFWQCHIIPLRFAKPNVRSGIPNLPLTTVRHQPLRQVQLAVDIEQRTVAGRQVVTGSSSSLCHRLSCDSSAEHR